MHDEKTKEKVQVIVDVMQCNATYFLFLNVCSTWAPPISSFVSLSASHGPRISWHCWGEYGHRIMNGSRFWTLSITLFILEPLFIIFHEYTLRVITCIVLITASERRRREDVDMSISILIRTVMLYIILWKRHFNILCQEKNLKLFLLKCLRNVSKI